MSIINSYKLAGSANLQTSTAETEILDKMYYDFEFVNDQPCHVSVNSSAYIYLRAGQGLELDTIFSLKIQESGITFNWIGEYS